MVPSAERPDDVDPRASGGRDPGRWDRRSGGTDRWPFGTARGYALLSEVGTGVLRSVDVEAAERLPGVLAVYSPFRDAASPPDLAGRGERAAGRCGTTTPFPPIRHYGQVVGLVVAETFDQARSAAGSVAIQYSEPAAVGDTPAQVGDVWSAADAVTRCERFARPDGRCPAIEPHSIVAVWLRDVLTVYSGAQPTSGYDRYVAAALGLDVGQVRLVTPGVDGGCSRTCLTWPHACMTAAAARVLDRPVKTIFTREQMLIIAGHARPVPECTGSGLGGDELGLVE